MRLLFIGLLLALIIPGYPHDHMTTTQTPDIRISFDFQEGAQGWEAGFADYSPVNEGMELEARMRDLPPELGVEGGAFYIQGYNRSDDLFMFLKRRLGPEHGVQPNQSYRVHFRLVFASNAPSGCFGVGGAPGESVYLKAGAIFVEPLSILVQPENHFRMNVNKGNQSVGGPAASLIGDIANGIPCEDVSHLDAPPYVSLIRIHTHEPPVKASDGGEIWLLVGTDSGFESITALYYRRIEVLLVPVEEVS